MVSHGETFLAAIQHQLTHEQFRCLIWVVGFAPAAEWGQLAAITDPHDRKRQARLAAEVQDERDEALLEEKKVQVASAAQQQELSAAIAGQQSSDFLYLFQETWTLITAAGLKTTGLTFELIS